MEDLISKNTYPAVLSIAGSDSGGCAGIQADIKSISACGAFAATVITATTAQNTMGVFDIHSIPSAHIEKQLEAVLDDIEISAIKIGMLHSTEIIEIVQKKLQKYPQIPAILDPVMVATSGDVLLAEDCIASLKNLFPLAKLITPNLHEAEFILGSSIEKSKVSSAAITLGKEYSTSVLLKGGHLDEEDVLCDVLYHYYEDKIYTFKKAKINTVNTHGTGCSLSASIAAYIALGNTLPKAVELGIGYVHEAILRGKDKKLGKGRGPINHFGI